MKHSRLFLTAAFALLVAVAFRAATPTSAAPTTYTAYVGGTATGSPATFMMLFEPQTLIVSEGDSIQWKNVTDEPHTVTFLSGQAPPKEITLDNVDARIGPAKATYDGIKQLHSGFITLDPTSTYTVTFAKGGTYQFVCLIHPDMSGTVIVVPAGTSVPSQDSVDADGKRVQATGQAAATKLVSSLPTAATKSAGANGKSTWTVPASPYTALSGGYVAQNAFTPARIQIGVGDTVTWVNDTPQAHTITFPPVAGDPVRPALPRDGIYSASSFITSGIIGKGDASIFPGGTKFSLTFNAPGTYPFICVLHSDQGMAGVIIVGAPDVASSGPSADVPGGSATTAPTVRPPSTGDAGLKSMAFETMPFATVTLILTLSIVAMMKARSTK